MCLPCYLQEETKQLVSPETAGSGCANAYFKNVQVLSHLSLKCLAGNTSVSDVVQIFTPIFTLPELQWILAMEGF